MKKLVLILLLSLSFLLCGCSGEEPPQAGAVVTSEDVRPLPTEPPPSESLPVSDTAPLEELISPEVLAGYLDKYTYATMILSDGDSEVIYNEDLSHERHSPYSTFKIPNSLIALEEGVVSIESSLREWSGIVYNRPELNQNQDLASAMKHSCVWYYQELAREIGADAMQGYLDAVGYGNADSSGGIDTFWLGSSLTISPREQLEFIKKLYSNDLPFSLENIEYVKSIMRQDGYSMELYGKTGSSGQGQGWFVGWVPYEENAIFFSLYIEGDGASGLIARDKTAQIFSDLMP